MLKIKVSPFFLIFAAFAVAFGYWYELIIYIVCIVLHEMAHAETARKLGYTLNHIKLMPYGASLTGEFESARYSDEIIIALAGPMFNIIVALFFTALWWLAPVTYFFTEKIVWASFFTAIFNLIPIFPLDGGRVFLAALSSKLPRQRAYKTMRIFGYVFCIGLIGLFVLSLVYKLNITLAIVSVFLLVSTLIPDKNSKYQRLYSMAFRSERLKRGLVVREVVMHESATLLSLVKQINSSYYYRFLIVDKNFDVITTISESELEKLLSTYAQDTSIFSAVRHSKELRKQ